MKKILLVPLLWFAAAVAPAAEKPPVRFAMIGLVHDHATGFIASTRGRTDVQLVGIVESRPELVAQYAKRYHLDADLFFPTLEALLAAKKGVQAVATFTSTLDHRRVVEMCAPLGLDVMMEKPLAVSAEDARAIAAAAQKGGIQVVVNYETTWYPANRKAYELVHDGQAIGELRKIVVHDGHQGPKEIGCSPAFLEWLTDPRQNGGGALMDFGCYGADLITWLMDGQRPVSVTAVTQQIKPDIYPKVDDEATIVLTYPRTQGIIQASWNWPYGRKDMEIYGQHGTVFVPSRALLKVRQGGAAETTQTLATVPGPHADTLSYFAAVIRRELKPEGLSSLETNVVVSEILDAARESARTGRRVDLAPAR